MYRPVAMEQGYIDFYDFPKITLPETNSNRL